MSEEQFTFAKAYPSEYLRAHDLMGKDMKLTVTGYRVCGPKDIGQNGQKMNGTVLSFKETPKKYVAPKTVFLAMQDICDFEPKNWIGKAFTFYPTTCQFGKNKEHPCIRVK
tara:strand:+ start:445 stop:777 length:333 start_codon:yes stop_codon:yes gene_type:complete